ncbi:circadian clock-controlled protein daywake-like [Episyrphus balteatus]|uniref:circadian clock-controlled protein daywake-like n=1 Tax=Episyrphus balteatus TaxID=286459 RepID=UPI00248558E4|nr:circadian clock-controlled protein daywake-like [Episyrphus balteatus]XP_055851381.1 circadian clock-controlled protein daywake-like [Episyrphus balteatus]
MKKLLTLYIFGLLALSVVGLDYLTEKPDYLEEGCSIKDPEFSKCSIRNLQNVFNQLKDGIPGLKTLPKTDPYYIKKVKLLQNNNAAKFEIELANLTAVGFGKTVIKENYVDERDYSWKTKFFLPKLRIDGDYKINGRLLALTLKGAGAFFIDMENLEFKMLSKVKLYEKGGNTFGNVSQCKLDFKIGALKLNLDNLFNGQKELEDSMNTLLNENWMDFVDAMRPALTQMMEGIMEDNMRKVFHFVPAKFFIKDIPKSYELNGYKDKNSS